MGSTVSVNGTVTSPRSALLSSPVAGLVSAIQVEEGDRVDEGTTLLALDDELAQLAVDQAEAEVHQRTAELDDAKRRLAQAQTVGAKRGIAQNDIDALAAEVVSDTAVLSAATVTFRRQQALMSRHTIKAPFNGAISERLVELGEWVNPGNGVLRLVMTENLRFDFQVGQDYYSQIAKGAGMTISLDAIPGQTFPGQVVAIVPVKDPSARTFLVRARLNPLNDRSNAIITPGMSATGLLALGDRSRKLVIPRDAIVRFPDGGVTVWVVDTETQPPTVNERRVATGVKFDGMVEIPTGLSAGEAVVVLGNETLQAGQAVTLAPQ